MNHSKLLIIAVVMLLFGAAVQRASACDFPPKGLLQRPRAEFRGRYANEVFEFAVSIPRPLTGYAAPAPAPQHGFGVILGEQPQSYLFVNAERNSLEDRSAVDVSNRELGYLRKKGKTIESAPVTQSHLGQLDVVELVVTYTCPDSTERYVQFSAFALSPDKDNVYEVTLYSLASRYEHDRAELDQILKSWKYTGR